MSSTPLYKQFKRTGAYTLFANESQILRGSNASEAIHLLIGQSRHAAAPTNTIVRVEDVEELYNTFGHRDKFMERRGNYLIPHAEILLSQGPVFILNLRPYTDENKLTTVEIDGNDEKGWHASKTEQVAYTSMYDRTGFWKLDDTKLDKDNGKLLNFASFTNKTATILVVKSNMANTEFATKTVADYNLVNKARQIESFPATTKLADTFVDVIVFGRDLKADLESGLNQELQVLIEANDDSTAVRLKGATAQEMLANLGKLKRLASANYEETYQGSLIYNLYSATNDNVSIETSFNADARLHGLLCRLNRNFIEDMTLKVDTNTFDFKTSFSDAHKYEFAVLKGVNMTATQLVDGTALRQNSVLDLINSRGIKAGLNQFDVYDYKYIVDAFKTYIEPTAKWQLSKFAYDTKRIAYLHSTPFIKDFAKNVAYQDNDGVFDSKYIPTGGNETHIGQPTTYSMPGEEFGDVATFPFAAGAIYDDGTEPTMIPGNVIGAVAYGNKHLSATKKQYSIVNGPINGIVSVPKITDVEKFSDYDLDNLEPYGWNMIINRQGTFEIRNDATASNKVKSALSFASNYELMTYLAVKGHDILERKIGQRNNETTRIQTKGEIDAVCNALVAEGVIESYKNICDLSNNTAKLRGLGFLVLDTEVVTADGIRIAVHRIIAKIKNDATGVAN